MRLRSRISELALATLTQTLDPAIAGGGVDSYTASANGLLMHLKQWGRSKHGFLCRASEGEDPPLRINNIF